jgi:hypothetical protein
MIGLVYIGQNRFPEISKINHELLIQRLSKKWVVTVYDFSQPNLDRSDCPFPEDDKGAARLQVWDFYKAVEQVQEQFIIKVRKDVWFTPSSIDVIVEEIESIINEEHDISFCGMGLLGNPPDRDLEENPLWKETYFKYPYLVTDKVLDWVIICNKEKLNDAKLSLAALQVGKMSRYESANSTYKLICSRSCKPRVVACQLYLIRNEYQDYPVDWQVGWDMLSRMKFDYELYKWWFSLDRFGKF